jgi:transposase-like protein
MRHTESAGPTLRSFAGQTGWNVRAAGTSRRSARSPHEASTECDKCRYQFSVTAGTLIHDSHLPLWKWFLAVYLMCESKKGISAKQLQRMLKVSYKTAWYLTHRIRDAMGDGERPLLTDIVEVDETYVGGKRKGYGGYRGNKERVEPAQALRRRHVPPHEPARERRADEARG